MEKKLIVVVGAGTGVGNAVAKKFGSQNFRVVLVARRQEALTTYVEEFREQDIEAYAVVADASNMTSLTEAFAQIKKNYGTTDVLVYNAAFMEGGRPTTLTAESLLAHYQVDVVGALHAALQVIPDQIKNKSGTILFTGGGFAQYPSADYAAMSIDKAALRNLALTMAEEVKPQGIFVGIVTIAGMVAPETHFSPDLIAQTYWDMHIRKAQHEVVYQ